MLGKPLCLIFLLVVSLLAFHSDSLPLSTNKRWIVDAASGKRVKLHCVNWAGHLNAMVVEGLSKVPLKDIVVDVKKLGFNCVRLTWATHMFTRYANRRVDETLRSLNLPSSALGIAAYTPSIAKMTVVEAYDAVVDELGKHGLMVVADNHVSDPKWCCGEKDGNTFFGDIEFSPEEWLKGLSMVANCNKGKSQVVAMGLRNELRGPLQNQNDWYKYMSQGAITVHQANPDVLVIVSGLSYDTDLSFLKTRPLNVNVGNKLVYEVHSYAWSGGSRDDWTKKPVNQLCATTMKGLSDRGGFLISGPNPAVLFMSEFGMNMEKRDENNNRFLSCILAYLAGVDLDWALWALQGDYYTRELKKDVDESFGIYEGNWRMLRYPEFTRRFQLLQMKLQDPTSNSSKSYIMYHPLSGQCVQVNTNHELELSDCKGQSRWSQEGLQIKLMGNGTCIKAIGEGSPPTLSEDCTGTQSSWRPLSASYLHLGTLDRQGQSLCLQRESPTSSKIVTKRCICVDENPTCLDSPQSQWFQLVSTNV